ncbi:hypothetical protein [Defluviimonas sp. SAOS-178_SWC]|uniref:hypothetical protein n=1 Tax=Defluviimonas sp. SAOS-178_SWC TaxID=3121287 RepID=UPI0032221F2C
MTPPDPKRRRFLIGAASFADAESVLRLAEQISGALALELGGLLIEDSNAFGDGGPPRARVVTSTGFVVPGPSAAQAGMIARAEARAFRAALSRLAAACGSDWSFETRAGELVSGLIGASRSWDLVAIGYRQTRRSSGRVILIGAGHGDGREAEALVDALVAALGVRVERMPQPNDVDALNKLSRSHAAAVVLDLSGGTMMPEVELRRLVDAARCPVLIVGAGHQTDTAA